MVASPVSPNAVDWNRLGNRILQNRRMSIGCMGSICLLRYSTWAFVRETSGREGSSSGE